MANGTTKAYIHLSMKSGYRKPTDSPSLAGSKLQLKSNNGQEITLVEGDGLYIDRLDPGTVLEIDSVGSIEGEFLLFEMSS